MKPTQADYETVRDFATRTSIARHQNDESRAHSHTEYIRRFIAQFDAEDQRKLHEAFNEAYRKDSEYYYRRGY
jgi:hypothetical protein